MMTGKLGETIHDLNTNRYPVQPLRLPTNIVSPFITPRGTEEYKKPLALSSERGGPLVPVYQRILASDDKVEEEVEVEEPMPWSLYNSIWGPRCEWSDGRDFFDHEEVLFERFATDWHLALRLGLTKVVTDNDEQGVEDKDADGIPDELEDVGAVLCQHHELLCLVYNFYADAVYGAGDDTDTGIKQNDGWKAFTDDCKLWGDIPLAKASGNNSLIFMAVDKVDLDMCRTVASQTSYRGRLRFNPNTGALTVPAPRSAELTNSAGEEIDKGLEAATKAAFAAQNNEANAFRSKATRQLLRL